MLSCMLGVATYNPRGGLAYRAAGWDSQEQIHKSTELNLKGEKGNVCATRAG